MRGLGQIAELCAVAKPDVGVITSIGPVHLELLGTVENVAKAKSEVVAALPPGGTAVVPDEPLLAPYLTRDDIEIRRFGPESVESFEEIDGGSRAVFSLDGQRARAGVPVHGAAPGSERGRSPARGAGARAPAAPRAASTSSSRAGAARSRRCPAAAC